MTVRFKIVFNGELMSDASLDDTKDNLAHMFKSERSKIESLFSGSPVVIKRDLSEDEADKYLIALQRAGAKVRKEQYLAAGLSLVETDDHRPAEPESETQMTCPKCASVEPKAAICSACGVVIEKYLARQTELRANPLVVESAVPVSTASPYAPPQAQVGEPLADFGELKVFGIEGRIGRVRYLAWTLVLMLAAYGAMSVAGIGFAISSIIGVPLMLIVILGMMVVSVQIAVKRLHDIGWSGWLYLLSLVPLVNAVFALLMLIIPGNTGTNQFGPPPPPNSNAVKVLAWLWLAVPVLVGILAAIAIPAYQDYMTRAAARSL